jgi:hypothetical protein
MTPPSQHPPANQRCQIYSESTCVRCSNDGTHWVPWGRCQHTNDNHGDGAGSCEADFYSWECDSHLFGEAA